MVTSIRGEVIALLENYSERELKSVLDGLKRKPIVEITENYLSKHYDFKNNIIANRFDYSKKDKKEFTELNENNLYIELQKKKIKVGLPTLKALLKSDFVPQYNPLKEYFESLSKLKATDKDYINQLASYASIVPEDRQRFNYHFKKHFVRIVACALSGFANKQCLVFAGEQNNGKTTFIEFLLPKKLEGYMAENIGTDKDSLIALSENLIINLDELSTLSKSDTNALKSVFSKTHIKVRKPYDSKPSLSYRVASFFGSTNKTEFLTDETGSVRWLIFDTKGLFNFNYSKEIDMNKVYAQAYALYKAEFKYELTPKDVRENNEVNKKYQIETPEMDAIKYIYAPITKDEYDKHKESNEYEAITATEIKQYIEKSFEQRFNTNNIGKGLRFLGFIQIDVRRSNKGIPIKAWLVKRLYGERTEC